MGQPSSLQLNNTIITVASWEDRFLLGTNQLIEKFKPSNLLMFYYKEYAEWSSDNRSKVTELCKKNNINLFNITPFSFGSPLASWKVLVEKVNQVIEPNVKIMLDISTMPREVIWSVCNILSQHKIYPDYVYNKPQKNGYGKWLSRDPGRPRFLYKLAGIQHLGRKTALVIQTGYDVERVKQLMRFYEPDKLLLGLQTGGQFENVKKNRQKHEDAFLKHKYIDLFDVDGYSSSNSFDMFSKKTESLIKDYNVILSSLGPKVGALALFMVKQKFPEVAMSYAPSNEFNKEYSKGIGACIQGNIED